MNTRKFDVAFNGAHYFGSSHEIEMRARVTTDGASHGCRLRMCGSDPSRTVWADGGRVYTPEQASHVEQLFNYKLPNVQALFQAYLTGHNYGQLFGNLLIDMSMDAELHITQMSCSEL